MADIEGDAQIKRPSLGRSSAIMASGTAVSRVLGFIRNALLVAAIGVNAYAANAFDVANKIPNALYAVLAAGVINSVLVPQIVRAFHRPDGKRTVDRIVTWGLAISLAVTLVFTAGASVLVVMYSSGWDVEQRALATGFALWVVPQLFFYAAYTILGQVLNAKEQFGPYMWAPVLNNVVAIAGLLIYLGLYGAYAASTNDPGVWSAERIALLAGSATLGIASQALILLWPLLRGGYRPKMVWGGPKGELAVVRTVAGWALAAVAVEQVGVLYATRVTSAANPGGLDPSIAGNAAYFQALTLYLVPHSLITVSIATALTTTMSRHFTEGNLTALRADVSRGLRVIATFTFLATAGLIVLAPWMVRLALPTVTPTVVQSVANVVIALAIGLVPLGAMVLVKRVYYVLEDAKGIFYIHIPMALTWIVVAFASQQLLEPQWWTVGAALGLAASNVVGMALRSGGLRRRLGGLDGRRVVRVHALSAVAALVAGGAGWAVLQAFPDIADIARREVFVMAPTVLIVVGAVMCLVYLALLWLMRVQEARDLVSVFARRVGRRVR